MTTNTIAALATASVSLPIERPSPDAHQLAGIGLLVARRDEDGWMFGMSAKASTCEAGEKPLLVWALKTLPEEGMIVGWHLAEDVVPALLSAAKDAEPELSHDFLQRVHALLSTPSEDLALDRGGAAAPPLHDHLHAIGLVTESIAPDLVKSAWVNRRTAPLLERLRSDAVSLMHLWLMTQPDTAEARVAMGRWLAERRAAGELP